MGELYNQLHCSYCEAWTSQVAIASLAIVLVLEHALLLFKMLLAYLIPDKPNWILDALARKRFMASAKKLKRQRASTVDTGDAVEQLNKDAKERDSIKDRINLDDIP